MTEATKNESMKSELFFDFDHNHGIPDPVYSFGYLPSWSEWVINYLLGKVIEAEDGPVLKEAVNKYLHTCVKEEPMLLVDEGKLFDRANAFIEGFQASQNIENEKGKND